MRSTPPLSRLALAILIAMVLLPGETLGGHDLTCHPPRGSGGGGAHEVEYQVVAAKHPPGMTISTLTVRFPRGGGSPHVTGAIVLRGDTTGQATTWTAIALAESGGNTGASAECADGDDDDALSGLTRLEVPFRRAQTGEIALLTFIPATEIDESGAYRLVLRGITSTELALDVKVRMRGTFGEAGIGD